MHVLRPLPPCTALIAENCRFGLGRCCFDLTHAERIWKARCNALCHQLLLLIQKRCHTDECGWRRSCKPVACEHSLLTSVIKRAVVTALLLNPFLFAIMFYCFCYFMFSGFPSDVPHLLCLNSSFYMTS